jgi:hypothetical protein
MNRIDLTRTLTVPAGELSLLDALEDAAQYLHDADGCALVQSASERLDAVLINISAQLAQQPESKADATWQGVTVSASASSTSIAIDAGLFDTLDRKANQLAALLALFYGERGDTFRCLDEQTQDAAHWLAADLGNEVRLLAELAAHAALQPAAEEEQA